MLPSQVLEQASTLDLFVFDVAVSYRTHVQQQEQNREKGITAPPPSEEDLLKGLENFRASNRGQPRIQ
jgi:hypothetical protein